MTETFLSVTGQVFVNENIISFINRIKIKYLEFSVNAYWVVQIVCHLIFTVNSQQTRAEYL